MQTQSTVFPADLGDLSPKELHAVNQSSESRPRSKSNEADINALNIASNLAGQSLKVGDSTMT